MTAALARDVKLAIRRDGQNVRMDRPARGSYNPGTDSYGSGSAQSKTLKALVLSYRRDQVDGMMIVAGDRRVIVAAEDVPFDPKPGDRVGIGGLDHQVVMVEPVQPGPFAIGYSLQVRR